MSAFSAAQRLLAAAVVAGATALLASAFLVGAAPDEEEFRNAVLTTWLHVRGLSEGRYAFWTPLLGLGTPAPLIANFWLHPLLPLLPVLTPVPWIRVVLLAHSLGAAGIWLLCRTLAIRPVVSAVCVATFLLSASSQNYVMADFWPSSWAGVTMMPWVLLAAWRVLHGPADRVLTWSVLLGLIAGLAVSFSNPGNLIVFGVLAPPLLVARWRAARARWRQLALAGAVAAALAAPNVIHLLSERAYYPPEFESRGARDPLPPSAAWDVFLRPLSASDAPWRADVLSRGARTVFFGGPFAVLCLVAFARRGWERPELAAAIALAAIPAFVGAVPHFGASDRYYYRDPIALCGIVLAGMAAERGLRGRWTRPCTVLLLAAQPVVIVLAALPFLQRTWTEGREGAPNFAGATGQGPVADLLAQATRGGGRLLFSPLVDTDVRERGLLAAGLGVNALAFRDVPIVNAWLVGVSADSVWPDERLYYARIRTPEALMTAGASLDVLGIRYVLARREERVASGLRAGPVIATSRHELVLYENADAWSGAFLLDPEEAAGELPRHPGCENDRVLCLDLAPLAARARRELVNAHRSGGAIDISMPRLDQPAVLVVTEMFRPGWQARSSVGALTTGRFAGGLLRVDVPAGLTAVRLLYRPPLMIASTIVAWSALAASAFLLARRAAATGRRMLFDAGDRLEVDET